MKCPTPCYRCGEIVELDGLHFNTGIGDCNCGVDESCTHGICDECFNEDESE